VSGRGALVPEPQRDHGKIDASLQQMHRRRVTERVQRDPLGFQRLALNPGGANRTPESLLHARPGEGAAAAVGERGTIRCGRQASEPALEHPRSLPPEWDPALSLAKTRSGSCTTERWRGCRVRTVPPGTLTKSCPNSRGPLDPHVDFGGLPGSLNSPERLKT
jgi:hypothetical protein